MQINPKIAFLICLVLISSFVFSFTGGDGTSSNPYLVSTCVELQDINSYLDANFRLSNDINCYDDTHSNGALWNNGKGFEPIGEIGAPFRGNLNGDYHIVYGLHINVTTGKESVGLIELANRATVEKIGLKDANIIGEKKVGGLIGHCENNCQILNSFFDGTIKSVGTYPPVLAYSGGLLGYNSSSGAMTLIKNCFVMGNIQANYFGGGITSALRDVNILNSYNLATVSGIYSYYGGISSGVSASTLNLPIVKNSFTTGPAVGYTDKSYSRSNIYCLIPSGTQNGCTHFDANINHYYPNTFAIYNQTPSWNDGNWIWNNKYLPYLAGFTHCTGTVDPNAEIYEKDWFALKTTDNTINVLSNSNTSRTCEWYCTQNYYKGSGANANTCVPYFPIGSGTLADPWIINNCIDLQNMKVRLDGNYALGNDINCYNDTHQGGALWNDGNGFYPIGYETSLPFTGSLDGRNKVIYGLYINRGSTINDADYGLYKYTGLIGRGEGCTIKDLGLEDVNITGGYTVGGIAGELTIKDWYGGTNRSTLSNSYVKGFVQSTKGTILQIGMVGGLVGSATKTDITNSYFDGTVKGHYRAGGIIGSLSYSATIKNTFVTGHIFGTNSQNMGGIAGYICTGCQVSNSYNLADINAEPSGTEIGGLVGTNSGSLINSFSTGTVKGYLYGGVGQVIGYQDVPYGASASNLHCLNPEGAAYCTLASNKSDFFSNTHPVYSAWNDGNWFWPGNFFPQFANSRYCSGPIDSNAEPYDGDWTALKSTDNLTNILTNGNTSRTCEWHCKNGFEKGTGADENKCVKMSYFCVGPMDTNAILYEGDNLYLDLNTSKIISISNTPSKCEYYCRNGFEKATDTTCSIIKNYYSCTGTIDPNAVVYQDDNIGITVFDSNTKTLVDLNTSTKCQYHCKTGYYRGTGLDENTCLPYTCINPILNASYYLDDNTGIIPFTDINSSLTSDNNSRKCQMNCDVNYYIYGNICVADTSGQFGCTGPVPTNAELISLEETSNLTRNIPITVVEGSISTPAKCEYRCLANFKRLSDQNCVPSSWVIGKCSSKTIYSPTDPFPIGALCVEGTPFPVSPQFGADTNIANWVCVGDYNASCSARRVNYDVPSFSSCSILDLTAGQEKNGGGVFIQNYCSCETTMDLTLIDYETGEVLETTPSSVACNEALNKRGFGLNPITKDTLIQIKASISNSIENCTTCELITYLSYQTEKPQSSIPDNSLVLVLIILGIVSLMLIKKKRI